jgi:hypothetical protein
MDTWRESRFYLKREPYEVCINPKGISPWVTLSAGKIRGPGYLYSLVITNSRACYLILALPSNRNTNRCG